MLFHTMHDTSWRKKAVTLHYLISDGGQCLLSPSQIKTLLQQEHDLQMVNFYYLNVAPTPSIHRSLFGMKRLHPRVRFIYDPDSRLWLYIVRKCICEIVFLWKFLMGFARWQWNLKIWFLVKYLSTYIKFVPFYLKS